VSLDRFWNFLLALQCEEAGAGDWDARFGSESASVSCTELTRSWKWSARQRAAGAPQGARNAVKSGVAPGSDRLPVCSGFVSIAEVVECGRARSSTPLVVADGVSGRAKPVPAKAGGGDAVALGERRCPELALNPASFTRRRGSRSGTSEVSHSQVSSRKKTPTGAQLLAAEVGRAP
jgi:hypothetical protein